MSPSPDTWRKLIAQELELHREFFASITKINAEVHAWDDEELVTKLAHYTALDPAWLDLPASTRVHLTFWTLKRVYFTGEHDSNFWCASVPRHPSQETIEAVGGGGGGRAFEAEWP